MATPLACPYCYETFTAREIMFRCNGRLSRSNRQCTLEPDPVLLARMGRRGDALGPVVAADGRKGTANCPDCGGETTYRICPICHSQLPVQFGMVGSRMIAMAGAKDSGKTVYMTVLLHELKNRVGDRFGAAIMGADDETRKQFVDGYENPIYKNSELPPTTQRATQLGGRVAPLVFRFSARPGGVRASRPEHTLLSFFDTAGEDFREQESLDVNTRYLACADGILLLLDPLQMAGARKLAVPGTRVPGTGPEYETPLNILSRVTDILLARNRRGARAKIPKPIAVVFTKLDAVWHGLDRVSPLRAQAPDGPKFDVADCLDVHEEIRHLLREWEGGQISQILENNYARYRYFGVSALGQPPTDDNFVAPSGIQPYRVADPLLWMLAEFGAVPRTGKG